MREASEDLLCRMLGAGDHVWSVGTPAAVMGFVPAAASGLESANGTAALRLRRPVHLLAFETLSSDPRGWAQGLALCVRCDTALLRHAPVVALDADHDAIRPEDRARPVFDLGIGHAGAARLLLRPDAGALGAMRARCGEPWGWAGDVPGTWIVETPIARLEQCDETSVLRLPNPRPSHSRMTPVPRGWVPVAHVFPPHPLGSGVFDDTRHIAFQALLADHGRPDLWALKQRVLALLAAGRIERLPAQRHAAAVIRVALRQWVAMGRALPPAWIGQHERGLGLPE